MMKLLKRIQYLSNRTISLNKYLKKRPQFVAALFFVGLLFSCEKPEQDIGLGLQPGEDILSVNQTDTITVEAYTLAEEPIRSDDLTPALLGAYDDPVFGLTNAGHATELRLSSSNPSFVDGGATPADIVIDSLVLFLTFETVVESNGNLVQNYAGLGPQYVEVFEITDSLEPNVEYFSDKNPRIAGEDLVVEGFNKIYPNPSDSVTVGGEKRAPQIRIPLEPEFARKFIEASDVEGGLTAENFVSLLKGLYIQVNPEAPFINLANTGILYWDTFRDRSGMTMYYKNPVTEDTLEYTFDIRANTGKYTRFEHDFTGADMDLVEQLNGNKEPGKQKLFVQAMAGTKIRVDFPYLSNLADSTGIALNKVELILPVQPDEDFPPPSRLFIFGLDEEERLFLIPDQLDGIVGGAYDAEKQEYRFVITRFVQQVLLGNRVNYGLEIVSNRAAFSGNRVVINGTEYPNPDKPDNNLKLVVTLTNY